MNEQAIQEVLNKIKNPNTGKSFTEENRWKKTIWKENQLTLIYDREGISPSEKKLVERTVVELFHGLLTEEQINILSESKTSSDVYKSLEQIPNAKPAATEQAPAQIKTGHGTVGTKKKVPGVKQVIAIGSGKGGVGKSTFTANIACTLKNQGHKVGIIDADIYGPSLPMLFGMRKSKPLANSNRKIIPLESQGIKFISFGLFVEEGDPVIWRGPMLGGVLNQFLFDVDWGDLDFLLIDLPPGTGDVQLSMVQNTEVDGAIIISTPQDLALLDATKGLEMFRKLNISILGMVENMSSFVCDKCGHEHFLFGKDGVENKIKELNVPFLGKIPLEMELRQSADAGVPYMANPSNSGRSVYRAYQQVAINLIGDESMTNKKSFFNKMMDKITRD